MRIATLERTVLVGSVGPTGSLLVALAPLPDPRQRRGRRYSLAALLTLAECAALGGARSPTAIAGWGHGCGLEIRRSLGIGRDSAPSAATFLRLFRTLDREALRTAVNMWLGGEAGALASCSQREGSARKVDVAVEVVSLLRDLAATLAERAGATMPVTPAEALALVGVTSDQSITGVYSEP